MHCGSRGSGREAWPGQTALGTFTSQRSELRHKPVPSGLDGAPWPTRLAPPTVDGAIGLGSSIFTALFVRTTANTDTSLSNPLITVIRAAPRGADIPV